MPSRRRILIAEDDAIIQAMYKTKFTMEGYDVTVTGDGSEALKEIAAVRPDVVLLDMMMPILNGIQVLERLSKDEKLKEVPVILLTNTANTKQWEQAMKLGARGLLIKSSKTPNQVVAFVKDFLEKNPPVDRGGNVLDLEL